MKTTQNHILFFLHRCVFLCLMPQNFKEYWEQIWLAKVEFEKTAKNVPFFFQIAAIKDFVSRIGHINFGQDRIVSEKDTDWENGWGFWVQRKVMMAVMELWFFRPLLSNDKSLLGIQEEQQLIIINAVSISPRSLSLITTRKAIEPNLSQQFARLQEAHQNHYKSQGSKRDCYY